MGSVVAAPWNGAGSGNSVMRGGCGAELCFGVRPHGAGTGYGAGFRGTDAEVCLRGRLPAAAVPGPPGVGAGRGAGGPTARMLRSAGRFETSHLAAGPGSLWCGC